MLDEKIPTQHHHADQHHQVDGHHQADSHCHPGDSDDYAEQLLQALVTLPPTHPDHDAIRQEIIEHHLPLADRLAHRYARHNHQSEDLTQVARLGLIKAVDGFDPTRGTFIGYAIPTIQGELKRYFRDQCWDIRPPRRLQELRATIHTTTATLTQHLGHHPTTTEIATHLHTTPTDILQALNTSNTYTLTSLNAPARDTPESCELGDLLGDLDPNLENAATRASLASALTRLPDRERRIILMRFVHDMTQTQIAHHLGISQMHVSRLLTRTLNGLRSWIEGESPDLDLCKARPRNRSRPTPAA